MSWKSFAKIIRAHGLKGDLICHVFSNEAQNFTKLNKLGISKNISNCTDSFEIENIKKVQNQLKLKLKNIGDRTAAEELIGSYLFVPDNFFQSKKGEQIYLSEILNFKVHDKKLGFIGEITSFSSNGPQDLLVVSLNNRQSEIPFVEAFIVRINFDKKTIDMDLPDGLIEVGID